MADNTENGGVPPTEEPEIMDPISDEDRCRFEVLLQNDMTGGDEARCLLTRGHDGMHICTAPEHLWYEPWTGEPDDE